MAATLPDIVSMALRVAVEKIVGAACQNRTDDLLITSEMLYQLS